MNQQPKKPLSEQEKIMAKAQAAGYKTKVYPDSGVVLVYKKLQDRQVVHVKTSS